MGQKLQERIEYWKRFLLDFGKRNRLINFKDGKRTNVIITSPTYDMLYKKIAILEETISFPYVKKTVKSNVDGEVIINADNVETSKTVVELQNTLRNLRYRAKTSIEEQGINVLFLTFGLLKWTEREGSSQILASPIILVPVKLTLESLSSPFKLHLHEDEIVVNPTLAHKFENDFGIRLPAFDSGQSIADYFNSLNETIENKGWNVERCVNLTILSYLKINMYKDLENNEEKLNDNPIIAAIVGEAEPLPSFEGFNNFDHDKEIRPIDTFQVVDADSSQQDAILLSKRKASFVLQGPPGTGKSQTITNIISEALADGKKVLFVSEKMAALQVVYNRLAKVGLSDFCFSLHNHKANKKEILRELEKSISMDRKKVREDLDHLEELERKRNDLNKYQEELHTPCSGLNVEIFKINGELAKLDNVPNIIFEIPDVDKITKSQFDNQKDLLRKLSDTIGKRTEDYVDNVWRNSTVNHISHELRHDIDSNVSQIIEPLGHIDEIFSTCNTRLGTSIKPSWDELPFLMELLQLVSKSPLFPAQWILDNDLNSLYVQAKEFKVRCEKYRELKEQISDDYDCRIYEFDSEQYKLSLSEELKLISDKLNADSNNTLVEKIEYYLAQISEIRDSLEKVYDYASKIAETLGLKVPHNLKTLKSLVFLLQALSKSENIAPTDDWFEKVRFSQLRHSVEVCRDLHKEFITKETDVLKNFDKEIFDLDFYPMLQSFRSEYNSFLRRFNGTYKADMQTLKKYSSRGMKLSFNDAFKLLETLKRIKDIKNEIAANEDYYKADFGNYYSGIYTQWEILENDLDIFEQIISAVEFIPLKFRTMLKNECLPKSDIIQFILFYNETLVDDKYSVLNSLFIEDINEMSDYNNTVNRCDYICKHAELFVQSYKVLLDLCQKTCVYDKLLMDLDKITSIKAIKNTLDVLNERMSKQFGKYYFGVDTDWNKILDALNYAKDFKSFVDTNSMPELFVRKVCDDGCVVEYCKTIVEKMDSLIDIVDKPLKEIITLFNTNEDFYKYNLSDLILRLKICNDKIYLLEEWVDYCSNKQKCEKAGLSAYIELINEKHISTDHIVSAYLKRFYSLWLDAMLPHFPYVQNFRSKIQDQTIKEFRELDVKQFEIAKKRIRERVIAQMPDFNSNTSLPDETAVLKRELNKQRRLMPLRKLFSEIPNLITSLRPCFMMSPLSVSVYLEAKSYDFDIVIFDEASQVYTSDAIGSIMRGKQVIIVGDKEQLPPTNFFETSLNGEDYDVNNDEESIESDADAYDSILDEASAVLPVRKLLWHYRSRHEHLIAFSNKKIYNNELITFPSSVDEAPDNGVEYIYVKDGYYDRGGKRNNVNEAKCVAKLVFDHFRKYPERSLGVVTFSEAQQNAVDAAIRQMRHQNIEFEDFFNEDKSNPFFIKNLENVQGDERDTIIFSIGYANRDGKCNNFGPLNRNGGYRRLNVAITRAKYNVKLVGSILPTDIDLDKTSARGVQLLRSYIEFARQGIVALDNEPTYKSTPTFDSPFEISVYDYLVNKGYKVETQVGCSCYRIDLAVKHPTLSGKFSIGIECDGASYHSSRTARERDRLRQDILEEMGWTIHRIWSTDWIKNQKTEEEKLVAAIEKSFEKELEDNDLGCEEYFETDSTVTNIEDDEEETTETSDEEKYGFKVYQKVNIDDYKSSYDDIGIIMKVIEIEQPIHFEELCHRVKPLFGNQRSTSKIKNLVEEILGSELLEQLKRKDDFITLSNFDKVQVRIPNSSGGYRREPIGLICDDELKLAMKTIVEHSFGITPDNLIIETARIFKFMRRGAIIKSTLRRIYENLLENGDIKEIDGKVALN